MKLCQKSPEEWHMPWMTGKERDEDKKVQGVGVESDPDTSSNMFPSFNRQTLPCYILQEKSGHWV